MIFSFGKVAVVRYAAIIAQLFALLVCSACVREKTAAASAASSAPRSAVASRVISTAPSNTEIIVALGLAHKLVAVDVWSADVEGIDPALPRLDFFNPDAEVIIGLNPDIIIANGHNRTGTGDDPFKVLRDIGINVVYIPLSASIAGICGDIITVADTLGEKERGEKIVAELRANILQIKDAVARLGENGKQKVYFEISPVPSLFTTGSGTYLAEMMEIAGAENVFKNAHGLFSPSEEAVIAAGPDIIFTNCGPKEQSVAELLSRRSFQGMDAIKEKRVYYIDANSSSRPNQNIIKAMREMAQYIAAQYIAVQHIVDYE
jgi:iron complex transport system substrate-binding protein